MNNKSLIYIISFTLFFFSCEKENSTHNTNEVFIESTIETETTKTFLTIENRQFWSTNDSIVVFNEKCEKGSVFTISSIKDGGATAIFHGEIPSSQRYVGFYPNSFKPDFELSDNLILFNLPKVQEFEVGTFANNTNPMIALTVSPSSMSFKNLCGLLDVPLKGNARIKKIKLIGNDESFALWGDARVDIDGFVLSINNSAEGRNELILSFTDAIQLSNNVTDFIFVVPEGALSNGFSVCVYDDDYKEIAHFGTFKSTNVIHKSYIRKMPEKWVYTSKVYKHYDEIDPQDRFLTLGFDDFRQTDINWVIPMLQKYNAHATFNAILPKNTRVTPASINTVIASGNEVGDHTIEHQKRWMSMPLVNGQNPSIPEGGQIPFPSNTQLRKDIGDGKNAFGYFLDQTPFETLGYNPPEIHTPWGSLSDAQCQEIRDYYSLYGNTYYLTLYDNLSNRFLGTVGSSKGSFDETKGCYTRGIFTDCRTSQNHEVWERIIKIDLAYLKEELGIYDVRTWSLPGSASADFLYYKNGVSYYDEECTKKPILTARFTSSYLLNNSGKPKERSWCEVLREHGFNNSHDFSSNYSNMMCRGLIINASLSRMDALAYSRHKNKTVRFYNIKDFVNAFFSSTESKSHQMYEDRDSESNGFYVDIENLRLLTSNGIIPSGSTDTGDSEQEKNYLAGILDYCESTGIKVINEQEAVDICFNHRLEKGNLIYNPLLRNTAKEYMPDASVPTNPDGYSGICSVYDEDGCNVLRTEGQVIYRHFGIPLGNIKFTCYGKGSGTIRIYQIRNNSPLNSLDTRYECANISIISPDSFSFYRTSFAIGDNSLDEYEQVCEGYGDKICGIAIVYSTGLEIKKIGINKVTGSGTVSNVDNDVYGEINGTW